MVYQFNERRAPFPGLAYRVIVKALIEVLAIAVIAGAPFDFSRRQYVNRPARCFGCEIVEQPKSQRRNLSSPKEQ
jgi:hypothetical protein